MNREEHLEQCKKNAREYLKLNDIENAILSMISDLSKHPETKIKSDSLIKLGMMYIINNDYQGAIRFIEGFH
jgi:transcriptional regulator NrdR family protein